MFSARVADYQGGHMLNICDADLLGRELTEGRLSVSVKPGYYGERLVDRDEAASLLRTASVINMAGRNTVALSASMGIGTEDGARLISGVPFLIVFRMG